MKFADLKNDFAFRRVFGAHPDILCALLNDLLNRTGKHAIEEIEYLPSEQAPEIPGYKLSILDVRCRTRSGETFVVEMQLVHVSGFLNRIIYNASEAYVLQLQSGQPYTRLADVVAIAICDFELWPDATQDAGERPRIPMLSRWRLTAENSGTPGLPQIQYAFLELPKLGNRQPQTGAEQWAWLFVNAEKVDEVPAALPPGAYQQAMQLANEASFTAPELEAYRKVMDEIQQLRIYGEDRKVEGFNQGREAGLAEGEAKGKTEAVLAVLAARGLAVSEAVREQILACRDASTLDRWITLAATAPSAAALTEEPSSGSGD